MPGLFRRRSNISCFFCHSPVPIPQNPNNFRCPTCQCWNRYDSNGEIMSYEPAMQDESLNRRSFAKRGMSHTLSSNNVRQRSLLPYLSNEPNAPRKPPSKPILPKHPQYECRVAMLPEYRESLHMRYPPVCDTCRPAVDDEIRRKDSMARVSALGGWLNETKGKEKQRRVSAPHERDKVSAELLIWRVRGLLWASTLLLSIVCNAVAAKGHQLPRLLTITQPALPILTFLSLLWTAWDPTYSAYRRAQMQGRDVRLRGKNKYNVLQMIAWLSRFTTSVLLSISWFKPHLDFLRLCQHPLSPSGRIYFAMSFVIELSVVIICASTLRLQRPPTIRLIDTKSHTHHSGSVNDLHSRSSTPFPHSSLNEGVSGSQTISARPSPVPADADLLASLSLSSKPIITPTKPVFGMPTLIGSSNPTIHQAPQQFDRMDEDGEDDTTDEMAMDWTPLHPSATIPNGGSFASVNPGKGKHKTVGEDDDGSWLRPQRFFAPEKPTGLEGLFERTKLVDDSDGEAKGRSKIHRADYTIPPRWIYALSIVPTLLAFLAWKLWRRHSSSIPMEYPLDYPSYPNSY